MSYKVAIVAGEASGDLHGGELIKHLKKRHPTWEFFGIGGKNMREAGVQTLVDVATLSTMGGIEIISHLTTIFRAFQDMVRGLKTNKPDLLILIDFPDFNLRLAKKAKQLGIKVLYYISPQIWAWRKGRIKIIKKYVDHMAVVLPFEIKFYSQENIPVTFVGHPLVSTVHPTLTRTEAFDYFKLDATHHPIIGLLPGSRHSEIERLLPILLTTAKKLQQCYPNALFLLPKASTISLSTLEHHLKSAPELCTRITESHTYDAFQLCDVTIAASGTVALELALLNIPMVIIYRLSAFSYFLGKLLIDVPFFALCNHIAYQSIVPELIQDDANPNRIFAETRKILDNEKYKQNMKLNLSKIRGLLGNINTNQALAELIEEGCPSEKPKDLLPSH